MTTSAHFVIDAMNTRKPGLTLAKQYLLLFFAQGHYLAWAHEPMFREPLTATDRGVTVTTTAGDADSPSSAMLVTVAQVVARYAQLSAAELRLLIQASEPWQDARKSDTEPRLDLDRLRDWFLRPDETDDPDDERPDRADRVEAEAYLASRGSR